MSPVQLTIRTAVPDDAAAVAVLLAELGYPVSVEEAQARIEKAVERILLAVEDGQIVGLLAIFARVPLSTAAPIARITAVVVRSTHRRHGVGRRLMSAAHEWALTEGCVGVELTSGLRPERAEAHRFYEGLGYAKTSFRFWLPLRVSAPTRCRPAFDPAGSVYQLHLNHIALIVADLDRSLDFYCRFFGFDRSTIQQYDDGVVFVRNADGFDLALKPAPDVSVPLSFLHFGFRARNPTAVTALQTNLTMAGVEVLEAHDEASYMSLKVRDPDGYVIETYWGPVP